MQSAEFQTRAPCVSFDLLIRRVHDLSSQKFSFSFSLDALNKSIAKLLHASTIQSAAAFVRTIDTLDGFPRHLVFPSAIAFHTILDTGIATNSFAFFPLFAHFMLGPRCVSGCCGSAQASDRLLRPGVRWLIEVAFHDGIADMERATIANSGFAICGSGASWVIAVDAALHLKAVTNPFPHPVISAVFFLPLRSTHRCLGFVHNETKNSGSKIHRLH